MRITNLRHVIGAAMTTPWAILPEKLVEITDVLSVRSSDATAAEEIAARIGAAKREQPEARVARNVAIIPVFGSIMPRANLMTELSGATSVDKLVAQVRAAVEDDTVRAVVLDIDSPGGAVTGLPEAAAALRGLRGTKPIVAVANHLAASAAYWIAAQADTIVASPSAMVGSVGVYAMHRDVSRALRNDGAETTIVRSVQHKAEGTPYEPLSDAARADLQARVNESHEQFVADLALGRGVTANVVRERYGEGRVLSARAALAAGMVDRVATLEEVLDEYGASASAPRAASGRRGARADGEVVPLASDGQDGVTIDGVSAAEGAGPDAAVDSLAGVALVAEEHPVTVTGTPAPSGAGPTPAVASARDERVQQLADLVDLRPEAAAHLPRWLKEGTTYEAARAEVLGMVSAPEPSRSADVRVGAMRETQRPWESTGHFFRAVAQAGMPGVRSSDIDPRLFAAATGLNQSQPSEGGFTVPGQVAATLWEGLFTASDSLLSRTDNYTVDGDFLELPKLIDKTRNAGAIFGGVQAFWINEADQITRSKPQFGRLRLEPQELAALVYATEKLLNNSPVALGQYIERMSRQAIEFTVNAAMLSGDGAGKPTGLLQSGAKITVAKENNQAAATINARNVSKMMARRISGVSQQYVWLYNVDIMPELEHLSTTVRNVAGTENVGGFASPLYNPQANTLGGLPLIANDHCEALGAEGDLILVYLPAYAVGLRSAGTKFAESMHVRFEFAEMAFRTMFDIDGKSWLDVPLQPAKGTTKSSIITLAVRN